jgi:transaldolase
MVRGNNSVSMEVGVKLFQDDANLADMVEARHCGLVDGFTTHPILMRRAGVADYRLPLFGKDPSQYATQTVKMFYEDARAVGFELV